MKSRVAIIVTLVSLVCLALLFTYNCSRIANEVNEELIRDLSVVCKVTGDFSRNDPLQARAQTLETVTLSEGTVRALFDAGGVAVYSSSEAYVRLSEADIAEAKAGEAVVYSHANPEGKAALYAI